MKKIQSPLTTLLITQLITLAALAIATLGLAACGSQQEGAVSVLHHFNKGNEAYRIEDYRRAITHFTRALELDDSSPDIQYNLGLAYYRSGNYEEAVSAFMAALKSRPTMLDAHYNLALAHDRLFNADAAHTNYNIYRRMVTTRNDPKAAPIPGSAGGRGRGSAAAIPAVAAFGGGATGRAAGGSGGRAAGGSGGTMVKGAALNGGGNRNGGPAMRGRPIPRAGPTGRGAARPSVRAQILGQGNRSGQSAATRPPAQARRSRAPAAYPAVPAPRQNTQNPSGDQQKWWIQDRFTRTR